MNLTVLLVISVIVIVIVVVPVLLYMYTAGSVQTRFPALRNKRICLLIAHPDDEAMFFAPTVLALTRPETGNHVKILCLSSGNAQGLGETRKKELVKSAMTLGLRNQDDVFVVENPTDFPDSMTKSWDKDRIANLLLDAFAPSPTSTTISTTSSSSSGRTASIDVLITFDRAGVSSHPNHTSLYHGARTFVAALVPRPDSTTTTTSSSSSLSTTSCSVDLYTLRSVALARKYTSILDALPTLVIAVVAALFSRSRSRSRSPPNLEHRAAKLPPPPPVALIFLSQLVGHAALPTAWAAMTSAHRSQMVWFRYLWIVFSRYMVINDLRLEQIKS